MEKRVEEKGKIGARERGLLGFPPKSAPALGLEQLYLSESFSKELLNCPLGPGNLG